MSRRRTTTPRARLFLVPTIDAISFSATPLRAGERSGRMLANLGFFPKTIVPRLRNIYTNMATGGGYRSSDHERRKPDKTPHDWRQQLPDSQSSETADDEEMSLLCPDQELEQDLSDLSLHREDDQAGLVIPGEEVSNNSSTAISNLASETESDTSPYLSATENNRTAIFVNKHKGAIPKTSTPKLSTKKSKPIKKVGSEVSEASTPPINQYFCRTSKVGVTVPSPVPPPNILDWYERVDDDPKKYENTPLTVLGRLEPLPQRSPSPGKANKRKRINSQGKSITTATSKDGSQIEGELNNMAASDVNKQKLTPLHEDDDSVEDVAPINIPWLLNVYPNDKPLPETLIGKRLGSTRRIMSTK